MQSLPASLPVLSIMVLVPLTGAALLWANLADRKSVV